MNNKSRGGLFQKWTIVTRVIVRQQGQHRAIFGWGSLTIITKSIMHFLSALHHARKQLPLCLAHHRVSFRIVTVWVYFVQRELRPNNVKEILERFLLIPAEGHRNQNRRLTCFVPSGSLIAVCGTNYAEISPEEALFSDQGLSRYLLRQAQSLYPLRWNILRYTLIYARNILQ